MCVKCPKWWLLCLFLTFYGYPVNHGEQSRIDDGCGESRVLPTHSQEQVECASVSQCFNYQSVHHSHYELSNGCILHNQAGLSVDSWFLAMYSWLTVTSPPAPPRTGTAVPSSQLFNFFSDFYIGAHLSSIVVVIATVFCLVSVMTPATATYWMWNRNCVWQYKILFIFNETFLRGMC